MTNSYHHIYLSPHYDDASLSCGGAIHQQVQAGASVLVITVFAAPPMPGEPLSPFAEAMHRRWGTPEDVIATRQLEDQASMEILGADYLRFKFTDCIYRGHPQQEAWYYTSDADIFGEIHPADRPLVADIVEAMREMIPAGEDMTIYAPLTVGHHVDHQLVHAVAWQLRAPAYTLAFYEDYPYAALDNLQTGQETPYTLQVTLAARQVVNWQPRLCFLSEENLQAKIESVRAYTSQLPVLFGSEAEMEQRVRNYALRLGQGRPAERIWLPGAG